MQIYQTVWNIKSNGGLYSRRSEVQNNSCERKCGDLEKTKLGIGEPRLMSQQVLSLSTTS